MGLDSPKLNVARLEIHRFRGIDSLTIDFKEHSVLIGPNGSGKNTVVDALSLRARPVRTTTHGVRFSGAPTRKKLTASESSRRSSPPWKTS